MPMCTLGNLLCFFFLLQSIDGFPYIVVFLLTNSPYLESLTQLDEGAPEKMERHLSQPLCTLTPSPDQV